MTLFGYTLDLGLAIAIVAGIAVFIVVTNFLGLEMLNKAIIDLFEYVLKMFLDGAKLTVHFIVEHSYIWVIWFIKNLINSHLDIFTHLTHSRKDLDPTFEFTQDEDE